MRKFFEWRTTLDYDEHEDKTTEGELVLGAEGEAWRRLRVVIDWSQGMAFAQLYEGEKLYADKDSELAQWVLGCVQANMI